jgi:hypothetical protein
MKFYKSSNIWVIHILLIAIVIGYGCERVEYLRSPEVRLGFSVDTLVFDTVLTNGGTVTKKLKVYNNYNQAIEISRIYLAEGDNSVFRMNVNGTPTKDISDIVISKKDSLYIFIEATLNSTNSDSVLLIQDSIVFNINSNTQDINLLAWGQDVVFLDEAVIQTETWTSAKPYLIYNSILIDSNSTLTIEAGTTIYFHKGSRMYAFGSIIANGTYSDPIVFRGDRLDNITSDISYDQIPDQWEGIWFLSSSKGNQLKYCNIRNGQIGIQIGVLGEQETPDLQINNCIIDNHSFACIFAINALLYAENCQISNAGVYTTGLVAGGDYQFYHCSFPNYFTHQNRSEPGFAFTNNVTHEGILYENDFDLVVGNSIIYGSQPDELGIGISTEASFDYTFINTLIRQDNGFSDIDTIGKFSNVLISQDPRFISIETYKYNFRLDTLSAAKDKGEISIGQKVPFDIENNSRLSDNGPDLGAFERKEDESN